MYYETRTIFGTSLSLIGEGHHMYLLIALFSRRDVQTHFVSLYLCLYYMQRHIIWQRTVPPLRMTYKLYKKRACLLRTDGVIRVFTFFCPKFHRVQCNFEKPFSAGRLAQCSSVPFPFVDINDLPMRRNLQHVGAFLL